MQDRADTSLCKLPTDAAESYKKNDVAENPKVIGHVGLLANKPPGISGCSLSSHPTNFKTNNTAVHRYSFLNHTILSRAAKKATWTVHHASASPQCAATV
jgi:hypothetical protein